MAKAQTVIGTPYYLPPEIVAETPYTFQADVWSLGILLAEMCLKRPPIDASNLLALSEKIKRGDYTPIPAHYSKDLKQLVHFCLQVEPSNRITVN